MDFEAHTISDTDFNGIKKLLQQVNMWLRNTRLNDISTVVNIYQNLYILKNILFNDSYDVISPAIPEGAREHL